MNYKIMSMLLLAVVSQQASTDVLRSVDKDGNITFSDAPVPGTIESENISIDVPAPSIESVNESQREAEAIIDKANSNQQKIDATVQREAQQQSTEQRIEDARKQLEASKTVGDGDRQGKAGGGTRLPPEYQERVRQAEQALKDAEAGKTN